MEFASSVQFMAWPTFGSFGIQTGDSILFPITIINQQACWRTESIKCRLDFCALFAPKWRLLVGWNIVCLLVDARVLEWPFKARKLISFLNSSRFYSSITYFSVVLVDWKLFHPSHSFDHSEKRKQERPDYLMDLSMVCQARYFNNIVLHLAKCASISIE